MKSSSRQEAVNRTAPSLRREEDRTSTAIEPAFMTVVEGAVEALDLAVPAWRVGRGGDVAGAQLGQQRLEVVAGVGLVVVAHHRLDRLAALLEHPRRGAPQRGGRGEAILGGVQLAVGQAAVVIDHRDHIDAAGSAGAVPGAIRGRPVPGPFELGQLHRVDVQQRTGGGPLIAAA
jgi:hypothetical protein